ncbi:MAG: replication initiator protein A, partial [Acutalibacter sp.]|nr:replication initiator protein A [Acutalibacter sp.]
RMSLSACNGWLDDRGRVFLYFTLEDAMAQMGFGHNKAVRHFKELEEIGLIERKKQGQGKPTRIYVKNFILPSETGQAAPPETSQKGRSAPAGETGADAETSSFGKSALPGEVTFVDAPFGNLRIEKYSNTGGPLSGVTFQVKHLDTGETLSGQTGPGGALEFTKLKHGGVEVRETAGIEGWQMDTETVKTATIVAGETSTVTFVNKELPGLRIVKYDLTTHQPMPGITFEIYKDGTSIGRYTTDAMGEILLTNLEPGTYLAKEVSSDDAHVVDSTPQEIELKAGDGIRELVFFNQKKPGIHLIKVDSVTMRPIPNVRFAFKQKDSNYQ